MAGREDEIPSSVPIEKILQTALEAAAAGASELIRGYRRGDLLVRHKGRIDLVTQYDLNSEKAASEVIGREFPGHAVLAEEDGREVSEAAGPLWYIDPLDGTTNFVHGHPFYAVSAALAIPDSRGRMIVQAGVVHAPSLREIYYAARGRGAWVRSLDSGPAEPDRKLSVSPCGELIDSLVNTGFPYNTKQRVSEVMEPFQRMITRVQAVRRAGAASLDLAYVASGRAEGYWEAGLKPWDVAAGLLLVTEAGGQITDGRGGEYVLEHSDVILASNGILHSSLAEILTESSA
ncbi:MAG: inositol monophosphatase [Deltaproteobacteria bacterium]|jgi:myo-inositol-1(or 4)-monophosphatase|nr:inositol monophosphatase [Deltaproteobacteria bacterium]